jgi:hypothetical protein
MQDILSLNSDSFLRFISYQNNLKTQYTKSDASVPVIYTVMNLVNLSTISI